MMRATRHRRGQLAPSLWLLIALAVAIRVCANDAADALPTSIADNAAARSRGSDNGYGDSAGDVGGNAMGDAAIAARQTSVAAAEFLAMHGESDHTVRAQLAHLANHTDHYRDMFPLAMTAAMQKRVLKVRNLLRTMDNALEGERGTRQVSELQPCRQTQ